MIKILKFNEVNKSEIFARAEGVSNVEQIVAEILEDVKANGDKAVLNYCERFDGAKLLSLQVSEEEIQDALNQVEPEFLRILKRAASNITEFHKNQLREGFEIKKENGVIMGQKITPIEKVGLYVPGGSAAYPSTVLMDSIPAKIAGCSELVITTPPDKEGKINPYILAAAYVAGVDKIFKTGGAQAVAALAFGTESVPKVEKIVGPGNAFVAEAKRQVYGKVSIDMIAGPSEILVISDGKTNPAWTAADLLSQAEHDKNASAVLITDSYEFALAVQKEIDSQVKALERFEIASQSIDNNGKIIVTENLEEAVAVSNEIAPEHLELCVDDPFAYLPQIKNAGSIFLGRNCPEALGDYMAGPNHTLPTMGTACFSSPLSVDDFVKKSQYTWFDAEAFADLAEDVAYFAKKEGLTGHAESALIRIRK
ncbi:MAG: histidinol dehydrogenase [Parasporobacterium sp.]|nr:histidinol dehydrogenase [Parasporobacterium sp.]